MILNEFLKKLGYTDKEIQEAVICLEWSLPIENKKLAIDCKYWWNNEVLGKNETNNN